MAELTVLEGEATPPTLEKWLVDYGKDHTDRLKPEMVARAIDEGYFFDEQENFTDKGFDLLREGDVAVKQITVLTLGRPITAHNKQGQRLTLRVGSQALVLFSGVDKHNLHWDDVQTGDEFPIMRLYRSSTDARSTHDWPASWPMRGRYIVG